MRNDKGFTIIEVVLVLAIAGLIFLIVFLALPQLQRSRRDTQRKSDASKALAALDIYAGNNGGRYPRNQNDVNDLAENYLRANNSILADPQSGDYNLIYRESAALDELIPSINADGGAEFFIVVYSNCAAGGNAGDIVIVLGLEEGGSFCLSSKGVSSTSQGSNDSDNNGDSDDDADDSDDDSDNDDDT